jgi:hypothetical protein
VIPKAAHLALDGEQDGAAMGGGGTEGEDFGY